MIASSSTLFAALLLGSAGPSPTPDAAPPTADHEPAAETTAEPTAEPTAGTVEQWREPPAAEDPLALPLRAHAGGLTADQVADRAVISSPQLAAKEAELVAAAAKVDQTMLAFFPQLELKASYTRLSDVNVQFGSGALVGAGNAGLLGVGPCPDGSGANCVVDSMGAPVGAAAFDIPQVLNQFSTQAMLSVPISDYVFRMVQGIRAARLNRDATQMTKEAEQRKIRVDARVAYYNWLRTVAQVAASEDALVTAKARLQEATVAHRAGVMTEADRLQVEALVADVERSIVEARAFETLARENISIMMDEPLKEYTVGESVLGDTIEVPEVPEMNRMVEQAMRDRPELQALGLNERALQNGIKTERAGLYPRLDAFAEGTYANPNQRFFPPTEEWNGTWSAGAQLTWNVTSMLTTRQRVKELKAQRRGLNANAEALRRGIRMEVSSAYVDRHRALASIALAEKTRVSSEAAYTAVAAQFRVGQATATDVIEAQGQQLRSRLQAINARIDLKVALAKLSYATGRPI